MDLESLSLVLADVVVDLLGNLIVLLLVKALSAVGHVKLRSHSHIESTCESRGLTWRAMVLGYVLSCRD